MTRESTEELRERLLRDEEVRSMIAMRAYEIYKLRGQEPGRQAEDWFQAENEVLRFLIEEESRRANESLRSGSGEQTRAQLDPEDQTVNSLPGIEPIITPETADRRNEPTALTAQERAESQSELGAWSPAQPDSTQNAPGIGSTPTDLSATKKSRAGTASKSSSPRKGKATADASTAAKKSASKKNAAEKKSTENAPRLRKARRPPVDEQ